jgi:cyclopropane fatty-acyl-phospholipid synthase-like methyltransferase
MAIVAESVRRYNTFFKKNQATSVLDYGTGNMRNALFLASQGYTVFAADLPEQVARLRERPGSSRVERLLETNELAEASLAVDLVLSTYVFNIIMDSGERSTYLANAVANLKPGGYVLMEVRCRREDEECDTDCAGYFSCAECSKTLTHSELDILLNPHGLRRISHYYRSHAVSAIYQKNGDVAADVNRCTESVQK